jgi:hypothetical protein
MHMLSADNVASPPSFASVNGVTSPALRAANCPGPPAAPPAHIRLPSWATCANFSPTLAPSQRPADVLPFLLARRGLVMHPVCRFTCEGTGLSSRRRLTLNHLACLTLGAAAVAWYATTLGGDPHPPGLTLHADRPRARVGFVFLISCAGLRERQPPALRPYHGSCG